MKRIGTRSFLIPYILLLTFPCFAQWSTVIDNDKYYFMGVEFKDENTAFSTGHVVGNDSAFIIRSIDGGTNWEETLILNVVPNCFDFINDTLGIAGGQDGALFKSTDGGNYWEHYSNLPGYDIFTIRFFNDSIGIASGHRTTDGGYTWTWLDIGNTTDIFLISDTTGFVTTGEGIFFTNDSGDSWLKVDPDQNEIYFSVCMVTEQIGYATKKPDKIYKTIDGGMSWFMIDSLSVYEAKQIRFTDENTGYLLVNNGSMRIMRTIDGGTSWDYVLFGTDQSYQMAIADDETILVPTINGKMYKTNNGGGDPILPRFTEIDWYSTLRHPGLLTEPTSCINSLSETYLAGYFKDTLFVNDTPTLISSYPQNRGTYILRYNDSGDLNWTTIYESSDKNIRGKYGVSDSNNNYYLIYLESDYYTLFEYSTNLIKYSYEGDSLWAKNITVDDTIYDIKINTTSDNHLFISGWFTGTFSYENNSIHTDNQGIFILKLDLDGNYVQLSRIVEAAPYINDHNIDINEAGSICLSFKAIGSVYMDQDTLDPANYYLLYLSPNFNLQWYNTEFDIMGKNIFNINFTTEPKILVKGKDIIDEKQYHVVYQYDDQGLKLDSVFIDYGIGPNIGNNGLCTTSNNTILASGNYDDFSIIEDDTLYGFNRYYNSYLYSFNENLEFIKSSHISGTRNITNILEDQHNSYIIGNIEWENVIFANDTIPYYNNYFIAKLSSDPNIISESNNYQYIHIYPNPSNGIIHINPNSTFKNGFVEIFDITGKDVYRSQLSENNKVINLSELENGIYIIQCTFDGNIFTQKIIIQ